MGFFQPIQQVKTMQRTILFLLIFINPIILFAQITTINRKVAQKNYEGYLLMQEKKYKEALVFFNDAINDDPEAYFIYQNRAMCYLSLKDTTRAINDFKTTAKLDPKNPEVRFLLGNISKNRSDTTAAIQFFKKAIDLADTTFAGDKLLIMNRFLGNVYFKRQEFDTALVYFNHLKCIDSLNSSVFISSAACYFYLNQTEAFCSDAERAYVLGGAITCNILSHNCKGCKHLKQLVETPAEKLNAVDKRLAMVIERQGSMEKPKPSILIGQQQSSAKVKVYYDENWQICLPDYAVFYRESLWSGINNFFGGSFQDFYSTGELFSEGTIEGKKMTGSYKSLNKNGKVQIQGQFANGEPVGKWTYFREDGAPDYEFEFTMDDFSVKILSPENHNYSINTGTGDFYFLIEKWSEMNIELKGAFKDFKRDGVWEYSFGDELIAVETYREGNFRKGYVKSQLGQQSMQNSLIKSSVLVPPHIVQISQLQFSSNEAAIFYPFISMASFIR